MWVKYLSELCLGFFLVIVEFWESIVRVVVLRFQGFAVVAIVEMMFGFLVFVALNSVSPLMSLFGSK